MPEEASFQLFCAQRGSAVPQPDTAINFGARAEAVRGAPLGRAGRRRLTGPGTQEETERLRRASSPDRPGRPQTAAEQVRALECNGTCLQTIEGHEDAVNCLCSL